MSNQTFSIGDREYTVEIDDFDAGDSRCGEPGSISLGGIVEVVFDSGRTDVVTLDTFLLEIAAERGCSISRATSHVEDECYQSMCERATERCCDAEYSAREAGW